MKTTTCNYFLAKDANAVVDRMVDIVCLASATNSNPQGDPLTNKPRRTSDGFGLITPPGLKNKVRQTVTNLYGDEMYIVKDAVLSERVEEVALKNKIDAAGIDDGEESEEGASEEGKDAKKPGKKRITSDGKQRDDLRQKIKEALAERYWDIRVFGGVLTAPWNSPIHGPVQFGFAVSENIIEVMFTKITRCCIANRDLKDKNKDNTFGDLPVVRFGLYGFTITVNPFVADKIGRCTWGDIDKLVHALQFMWSHTKAANRAGMAFERIDIFTHDKKGGSVPSERIARSFHIQQNANNEEPTSIRDFDVTVDKIPGVEHNAILLVPQAEANAA